MIKGCAKRVVVVRNIDSSLFEEAFFIVKSGQSAKKSTEEEFLGEAERLVKTTPNVEHAAGVTENSPPNRQESGSSAFSDSQTDFSGSGRFRFSPKKATFSGDSVFMPCMNRQSRNAEKSRRLRDALAFLAGFATAFFGTAIWYFLR